MSDTQSESVILCEGYHDRAFWAGWLLHLKCTDPGLKNGRRIPVQDPWGDDVKGQYAYLSNTGRFLRVQPCGGDSKVIRKAASARLRQRSTKSVLRLVINIDPDSDASGAGTGRTRLRHQDVEALVRTFDSAAKTNADGDIELDGGATKVSLIRWEVSDPPTPGLPDQQTLERLVCAALLEVYPERGENVQTWLDSRHNPPTSTVKEYAWSYYAGWYADHGTDDFYRCV